MPPKIESGHEPGHRARQGPRQHASVPTAARLPGSLGGDVSGLLLHLQRTAGNQAVNALLRDYATSPPPAPSHTSAATDVRTARFEIDSDGDQRNDLALVIRAPAMLWDDPAVAVALGFTPVAALDMNPTPVSVEITQLSSLATRKLEFDWPSPSARLFPAVAALTDGKGPTTILLTPSAGQQLLMVYPPTTTPDGLQYRVEAAGKDATLTFPVPAEAPSGAGVAAAGVPFTADAIFGTITAIDVTLGAYGDQFRIAIAPTAPDKALLAITAPHEGESRGMAPVPIALNAPLSMRAIDTGPVSLGLDLNGDDKPDIQIFDQLEIIDQPASPYAPDNSTGGHSEDRQHKVRATGPALGTDAIFPFTVQGDVLRSDVRAIAGITALDVPLGPFGDTFRLTFQPTAPDRALFGLSPKDLSSLNEGLGTEIALNGPFSVHMIDVGPASVGLDLNGDDKPEMEIVDQVDYWEKDEAVLHGDSERAHAVWVTGSAIGAGHDLTFSFTVQGGRLLPGLPGAVLKEPNETGRAAAANAMAVATLAEQASQGSIQQQLDAYEREQTAIRFKAVKLGVLPQQTYDAWSALSRDLIALEPQINQQRDFNFWSALSRGPAELRRQRALHSVDPTLRDAAATHVEAFLAQLRADRSASYDNGEHADIERPYAGIDQFGDAMLRALKAGEWDSALASYRELVGVLDEMMIYHLRKKEGPDSDSGTAQEAESLGAQEHALRDVAAHNPQRLLAVFLPDEKFRTEEGYVAEVPLSLYYWKEDDTGPMGLSTWHLNDLTNPQKVREYAVYGTRDQAEPPASLWDELDNDRFPVGVIRYQISGGASGEVHTTNPLTFKKFLGYLGMGLAALGFVLAPFDAPVVAEVFALSAVAQGAAAAMDLREHLKEGDLDATTALLDVAQIVSALAGTSALAAGRIRTAALDTAAEGGANAEAAARLATFANKVYVPMARTAAAADTVNLATFGIQIAAQLDEIEYSHSSRADKDRAKLRLLAQLAVTGHFTVLHIKGLASPPGEGSIISLVPSEQGGTLVAKIGGEESVTATQTDAPVIDPETGQPPVTNPGVTGPAPAPGADPHATPSVGEQPPVVQAPGPAVGVHEAAPPGPPRPVHADGRPVGDAAMAEYERAPEARQAVFRAHPDFLERYVGINAEDRAFLNSLSDAGFTAYAGLSADLQARFLAVSDYVYFPRTGQAGPMPPVAFRPNFAALPPARQAALLTAPEIAAMEGVQAMDVAYTNEAGAAQHGHSFAEHGAFRSDEEMFRRAGRMGRPVSRYNSAAAQEAQATHFRQIMENPATPAGIDSAINGDGRQAIANGTTTAAQILGDPAHHMQYLKSRVQFRRRPAGAVVGTEFNPDGLTTRDVEHVTVVFELDTTGHYQVLTNYPEHL